MNQARKAPQPTPGSSSHVELPAIESAALARLVEEVRNGERCPSPTAYNRTYHRHNR
jgi:hypothetical protein